jgi:cytochrome c553
VRANRQGVPPNPALKGKGEDELPQALKDYKSGKKANAVMKQTRLAIRRWPMWLHIMHP